MEEKYNFEKKKLVINNLIEKKINTSCVLKKYENLDIRKESQFCLFCNTNIQQNIYCSLICKEIYENNLINFKNNENVHFPSFELLINSSKKKYRNFIENIKKKKIKYDKVIIMYEYTKAIQKYNIFKEIKSTFILIKDYEKEYIEKINFNIIIFKTDIENTNISSFSNFPEHIVKELIDECLYCKKNNLKNKIFFNLPKNYILGIFCSKFCLKVFISINEEYIKQPYKNFFVLPHYNFFQNSSIINKIQEISNNKNNLKKIITYNVKYLINNKFEIIEIIY